MASAMSKRPSTLVILRKCHRFLHAKLRELAAEVYVLHRLWYKGAAQFRHMVWWRPVRRVKALAARITTGCLAHSVPLARGDAPATRRSAEEVVGVRLLRRVADAYAAHWGDARVSWSRYVSALTQLVQVRGSTARSPTRDAPRRCAGRGARADERPRGR